MSSTTAGTTTGATTGATADEQTAEPATGSSWSDAATREALQVIAAGVTEVAGFGVAAVSVVREEMMEVVAVAGSPAAAEQLLGTRAPVELLLVELARADDWGLLKFVPHERIRMDLETWGWVPDLVPLDVPDAWHPEDMLIAPLHDDSGTLRGLLSMDLPVDGRRPGAEQRVILQTYAEQAGRSVLAALEREELAERVRLAKAARNVVRNATGRLSMAHLVAECRPALVDGFRARGLWIQTFDEGPGHSSMHAEDGTPVELRRRLIEISERSAREDWARQEVRVVNGSGGFRSHVSPQQASDILAFLGSIGISTLLFVPLGAGRECLGVLILTRAATDPEWTEAEAESALDIGHDLGRAILNARSFEREHQLVEKLRALDAYKGRLIATVSHELKNPLAAITGHLEMMGFEEVSESVGTSLAAMGRGARRMSRVIDDLLLLSQVGDPDNPVVATPVDLTRIVHDVRDLTAVSAERRHLTVRIEAPEDPVVAMGDAVELDRVLVNLVSNAVKYTPEGRGITVQLAHEGDEIRLTCRDEGIGISPEDQAGLFAEFFRSTNPVAIAQPGTGLGLAIVERIVTRHGGRIEVESELGSGSSFHVRLPAAPASLDAAPAAS